MGGIGAAAGPLIGGLITTGISWQASFVAQALVVALIIFLSRRIIDPGITGRKPQFDLLGAILSAAGLLFVIIGILQSRNYGWFIYNGSISSIWIYIGIGAAFLFWFFKHIKSRELTGKDPLLSTKLFRNKTSNLGLVTQNIQWLVLLGSSFVISVFLQVVRGYNAIQTGLILTPATIGILLSSTQAEKLAKRYPQRVLVIGGFITTIIGILLLIILAGATSDIWTFVPGLFILGLGIGVMLTSSVTIVQSSFPEKDQGEISGLSRSVSNLGSSLGTGIAGSVIVAAVNTGSRAYGWAMLVLALFGVIGLLAAIRLPPDAGREAS